MEAADGTRARLDVRRLGVMAAVAGLHLAVYFAVNAINGARPPSHLQDLSTALDARIPYLGWTSFVYYVGDLYIILWAGYLVSRLPSGSFAPAMRAYAGMIVTGGAIQVLVPAHGPYPDDFHWLQATLREALGEQPYACLPSMHVALTVLPAAIGHHFLGRRWVRSLSAAVAAAVTVSTVTAREHYAVDALAGVALAAVSYLYWRLAHRGSAEPVGVPAGTS